MTRGATVRTASVSVEPTTSVPWPREKSHSVSAPTCFPVGEKKKLPVTVATPLPKVMGSLPAKKVAVPT